MEKQNGLPSWIDEKGSRVPAVLRKNKWLETNQLDSQQKSKSLQ
jgi:hypothetical protein